ncbi:hypothetical protein [Herbaspirillum rubrisubalbicans]|uniref:hypothetical protein n=1 Tax=Herbaspirillum rubrisubalbicans TaxID=80842 RepID=UPI00037887F4|nr:hypothetical protein [Herbaspirillum rubrisubalbicans]
MPKPRISLNKLGEYLTATPSRRKRIIEDQEQPKNFVATRYGDARASIVKYLAGRMEDEDGLRAAAIELRKRGTGSDFVEHDREASADAIDSFVEFADEVDLDGVVPVPIEANFSSHMDIAGVSVSTRPDLLLKDEKTGEIVGCVKLHFSKTSPLNQQGGEYVATALRVHLEEDGKQLAVDNEKVFVVDVPTRQVVTAPKAFKRKMKDIQAACEEIEARWRDKT